MVERKKIAYVPVDAMRRCPEGLLKVNLDDRCDLDDLVQGEHYRLLIGKIDGRALTYNGFDGRALTYNGTDEQGVVGFADQKQRAIELPAVTLRSLINTGVVHVIPTGRTKRRLAQTV